MVFKLPRQVVEWKAIATQQIHQLPQRLQKLSIRYQKSSISHKLNLGFGVLVLLTLLVVGRNYLGSLEASINFKRTQELRVPTALTSAQAQTSLLKMLSNLRGYLATGEPEFRKAYQNSRQEFESEIDQMTLWLPSLSKQNQQNFADFQALYQQWSELPEQLFRLRDNILENQPALRLLEQVKKENIEPIFQDMTLLIGEQKERASTNDQLALLGEMNEWHNAFILTISGLRNYLVTREPSFQFEYTEKARLNQEIWQKLKQQQPKLTPSQQEKFNRIAKNYQKLLESIPRILEMGESDRYREDLYLFRTKADPIAEEMLINLSHIVGDQQTSLETELKQGSRNLAEAEWQTLIAAAIALGLGTITAIALRRQIADPIKRLTEATTQIMNGDLETKARIESRDEIGVLATTFNRMVDYLKESRQALEDYSRTLEKRVEERTEEIQEKNEKLTQALRDLKKAQTQLVQTEKMSSLGQLVAGVAHEINNPVNFIYGNLTHTENYTINLLKLVKLYQEQYPETSNSKIETELAEIDLDFVAQDLPKLLHSMQAGAERIRGIVLSLRNFSRLDEAEMKKVDLHEGIDNTLLILGGRLQFQQSHSSCPEIEVIKNYGQLPEVECCAGQINQVFMNILTNAIDTIKEKWESSHNGNIGPPVIAITTQYLAEQEQILVEIKDNGLGMTPEVKQHLFDPFFTTKPVGHGTGLGLSICYQIIVEQHQGSIDCISQLGQGTEFVIKIPVRQDHSTKTPLN